MAILRKVRLMAAIALVCAIALPLSECQKSHVNEPGKKSLAQQLFPQDNGDFLYFYGYEALGSPLGGTMTVLAFAWPLTFFFFTRKNFGFRLRLFFQILEVLLCAGSIYWLRALTMGGRWLYGAYVGIAAVALFTGAGLASWFEKSLTKRSSQPLTGEKSYT